MFKVVNGLFKAEGDFNYDYTDKDLNLTNKKFSSLQKKSLLKSACQSAFQPAIT